MLELILDRPQDLYRRIMVPNDYDGEYDFSSNPNTDVDAITTKTHFAQMWELSSKRTPLVFPFEAIYVNISVDNDTIAGNFLINYAIPDSIRNNPKASTKYSLDKYFETIRTSLALKRADFTVDSAIIIGMKGEPKYIIQPIDESYGFAVHFGEAGAPRQVFTNFDEFNEICTNATSLAQQLINTGIQLEGDSFKKIAAKRYIGFDLP